MTILEQFDADPRFKGLARRRNNFRQMIEHAESFSAEHGTCQILETGTAWDQNNWDGQGQSTIVWDWLAKLDPGVKVTSIDIRPESTETARKQTTHVDYITGDSVLSINELPEGFFKSVGLLYLDSFDWAEQINLESSFHHMAELASCWRLLPSGCLVAVDDRHGDGKGKHWLVEAYMQHYLKLEPVFRNHQVGWIKP